MGGEKKTLTIITQNLNKRLVAKENGNDGIKQIYDIYREFEVEKLEKSENHEKVGGADIYAFQERGVTGKPKLGITGFITDEYKWENDSERAKEIWDKAFPWIEFKSGYWAEKDVKFAGKEITIINLHCSSYPEYVHLLRYTLVKRLKGLDEEEKENKYVILLGDFNAAFKNQTENPIEENHEFLKQIVDLGFEELLSEEEPHFTYDVGGLKKKLDHIFISRELYKLKEKGTWGFKIEYIDREEITNYLKSNGIPAEGNKTWPYGVDHDGIRLIIRLLPQEA